MSAPPAAASPCFSRPSAAVSRTRGILIIERRTEHGPRVGSAASVLQIAELARGPGSAGRNRRRRSSARRAPPGSHSPGAPRAPSATTARARNSNGRSAPSAARRAATASGRRAGVRLTASGRMRARSAARAAAFWSDLSSLFGAARERRQHRLGVHAPRSARGLYDRPPASPAAPRRRPPAGPPPAPSSSNAARIRAARARSSTDAEGEASSADNPATGGTAALPSAVVMSFSSFSLAPVTAAASASTTIGFFGAGASVVSASTRHSRAGPLAVNTACAVGSTAALTKRHHQRQARRAIGRIRQIAHQAVRAVGPIGIGEDRQITDRGRAVVLGWRRFAAGGDTGDHHRHAGRAHRFRQRHPVGVAPVRGVASRVLRQVDVEALPGRRPERDLQPGDAVLRVERLQAGAVGPGRMRRPRMGSRWPPRARSGTRRGRRHRAPPPRRSPGCRRRARAARCAVRPRASLPAPGVSTRRRNGSRRWGVRPASPDRRGARPASRLPAAGATRRSAESARRRSRRRAETAGAAHRRSGRSRRRLIFDDPFRGRLDPEEGLTVGVARAGHARPDDPGRPSGAPATSPIQTSSAEVPRTGTRSSARRCPSTVTSRSAGVPRRNAGVLSARRVTTSSPLGSRASRPTLGSIAVHRRPAPPPLGPEARPTGPAPPAQRKRACLGIARHLRYIEAP